MKLRSLSLGLLFAGSLVAFSAGAQTVYEDERMDPRDDIYQRDIDMQRGVDTQRDDLREVRTLPPRDMRMDVAAVDRRADRAFRQQTLGRKLGAADWAELRRQRSEIDDLKSRIRAGHSVSPSAVDRALGSDDQQQVGY